MTFGDGADEWPYLAFSKDTTAMTNEPTRPTSAPADAEREKVEIVARALCAAAGKDPDQTNWMGDGSVPGGTVGWLMWEEYESVAKSLVATIRAPEPQPAGDVEPTDAMIRAGARALDHPSVYMGGPSEGNKRNARKCWMAMSKARKEPR